MQHGYPKTWEYLVSAYKAAAESNMYEPCLTICIRQAVEEFIERTTNACL